MLPPTIAISLIVIRSGDLDRAERFYIGIGVPFVREQHGSGPVHLAAILGDVVIEIYPQNDQPATTGVRLGLRVAEIDSILAKVSELGGSIERTVKPSPWGRRAVICDIDGHRIELTESSRIGDGIAD